MFKDISGSGIDNVPKTPTNDKAQIELVNFVFEL